MPADWQLPAGVDRGLWDYLRSEEMVRGYDGQMSASPLARADLDFCDRHFRAPGRLIDLGCGTGRACVHFARKGFDCLGVDLSEPMLDRARENAASAGVRIEFRSVNLVDLDGVADASLDYAACLYSTFGMIRGGENRRAALRAAARVVKPGGRMVFHAHHRWFRGLGWRRFRSADLTMPQSYGGAPLALHHFTRREINGMLLLSGWRPVAVKPVGIDGSVSRGWARTYGFLVAAVRKGGEKGE